MFTKESRFGTAPGASPSRWSPGTGYAAARSSRAVPRASDVARRRSHRGGGRRSSPLRPERAMRDERRWMAHERDLTGSPSGAFSGEVRVRTSSRRIALGAPRSSSRLSSQTAPRRDPAPDPMGGVTDRAGSVRQSGRDRPVRARQRLGAGKLRRVGPGSVDSLQSRAGADRHRRLPVGHRVVDAPDDGPRAVLEGLDDVDRPQRPIAGQPFRHQPGDDPAQLRISDGAGGGHYGRAGARRSSPRLPTPARRDRGESSRSAADSSARVLRRAIRSRRYVTTSPVRSAITTLHVCPTIDLD